MRVLVACEESQRVCVAFRWRGHEANRNTVLKGCKLPCGQYNAYIDSMASSFSKFMEVLTEGENDIHA